MKYEEDKKFLAEMIVYLSGIPEDAWLLDRVMTPDGNKRCVMGHVFGKGKDDTEGNHYWDFF
jgi:hypothetical protein